MKKTIGIIICILLIALCSFALADVYINETTFPDPNFRGFVMMNYDSGWDDYLSDYEIGQVKRISCVSQSIASLQGIEYFTAATELDCRDNKLTSLNLVLNPALTRVNCHSNQLTSIDVSNCTELTFLDCGFNKLTSLDVRNNTKLKTLICWMNQLTALDVSKNTALTTLSCFDNELASLNVSGNAALTTLACYDNKLTALDLGNAVALKELECELNPLTGLDVSKNTKLIKIYCMNTPLTSLDLRNNTALENLDIREVPLTTLDLSMNTALTNLTCESNPLTSLDLSKNTALTNLSIEKCKLTALDVSNNTALKALYCRNDQLTALDISKNTALTRLVCSGNQLTALDVSGNTALKYLDCSGNQLTALDVSNNTALAELYCNGNQLTALDVSKTPSLYYLYCYKNRMTTLDVTACTDINECVRTKERKRINDEYEGLSYDSWTPSEDHAELLRVDKSVTVTAGDFVSEPLADNPAEPDNPAPAPADDPEEPPVPGTEIYGYVYATTGCLHMRREPSSSSDIICSLDRGTELNCIGPNVTAEGHIWYHVEYNNLRGYVNGELVQLTIFEIGDLQYTISNKAATVVGPKNKKAKKLTIPATVKLKGYTYKVTEIKENAFKDMKKLKETTIGSNIGKIGAKAYENCGKLKKITIKTSKLKKKGFGKGCFSKINAKAAFKVPKKCRKNYKTWIIKQGKAPKTVTVK